MPLLISTLMHYYRFTKDDILDLTLEEFHDRWSDVAQIEHIFAGMTPPDPGALSREAARRGIPVPKVRNG